MSRFIVAVAAAITLSACSGGNPFAGGEDPENPIEPDPTIPTDIAGDVDSITYDAVNQTLVVRGQTLDDTPYEATYRRRPALDRPGYEAYSSQESSLGRHHTAYARERDGASAGIVMAGGQFGHVFLGGYYERDGAFDAPPTAAPGGIVQYAGRYVGLLNGPGDGGDLLPVTPGTDPEVLPTQAAEVVGNIFIAADFVDNTTDGIVYDRVAPDYPTLVLADLELAPAGIDSTAGTFDGPVEQDNGNRTVGDWGGIFAGDDSSAIAGALYVEDHIEDVDGEREIGLFVLAQCGTPNADPICNQPNP